MGRYLLLGLTLSFNLSVNAKTISEVSITGEAEFKARSNLSALEIKGSSKSSTGTVKVSENGRGIALEALKINIPVASLQTGIGIRDRHMREKIFTTEDGKIPDVSFESAKSVCEKAKEGYQCQAQGTLSMHGKSLNTTIPVSLTKSGDVFVAKADFDIGLKDFGVEPPSHFGVTVDNAVAVSTNFRGTVTRRQQTAAPVQVLAQQPQPAPQQIEAPATPVVAAAVPQVEEPASAPEPAPSRAPAAVPHAGAGNNKIEIQLPDGTIVRGLNFPQAFEVISAKRKPRSIEVTQY